MRIVALALGVLASVVASLILALGGLDPQLFRGGDPRYFSFALSLIPSVGVFAAALMFAAPLVGAILMVLAGAAWVAAAILLHHGADMQLIAPPVLLLLGAAVAVVAFIRRPRREPVPRIELASSGEPMVEPMTASAMFESEPEPRAEPIPELAPLPGYESSEDLRPAADEAWRPGKRRPPPPRQEPVFREPDEIDEEPEESGFSRFARGVSGILSFGLYAALAGAAVLVYVNIRAEEAAPRQVAEIAPVASSSVPAPSLSSSAPAVSAPTASSSLAPPASAAASPVLTGDAASGTDISLRQVGPASTIFGAPEEAASSASFEPVAQPSSSLEPPASSELSAAASSSSEVPVQLQPENLLEPGVPAVSEVPATPTSAPTAGGVMPFTMPSQMAAEREQPSPGPSAAAPSPPQQDTTGL